MLLNRHENRRSNRPKPTVAYAIYARYCFSLRQSFLARKFTWAITRIWGGGRRREEDDAERTRTLDNSAADDAADDAQDEDSE